MKIRCATSQEKHLSKPPLSAAQQLLMLGVVVNQCKDISQIDEKVYSEAYIPICKWARYREIIVNTSAAMCKSVFFKYI